MGISAMAKKKKAAPQLAAKSGSRKIPASFRLSPSATAMLEALSKHIGIDKTSVLEMSIREKHRATIEK
jgi:hypothetical protein